MNLREEAKKDLNRRLINPITYLQVLSLLGIFSSVFIWIWYNSGLALKVFFTSLLLLIILEFVEFIFKEAIKKTLGELSDEKLQESRFAKRLKEKQNEKK